MSIDEIRTAALALAPEDRELLVHDLMASLGDEANEYDAAWGAEIERRYNEYLRGKAVLIDGEESIRRAREALEAARRERQS
ncbi:MAG TPA: addiction module protein [Planctomycetaceae bacterium]|nr:addiction module protein [Planctomycetaceae bacterium]